MRRPLVAGNWKMNCGPSDARRLALEIRNGLLGSRTGTDVVLCPPFTSLAAVREILQSSTVGLGAQNLYWEQSGAWTGEVSATMLRDAGCNVVLVGHSERRQHFGETNRSVQKRVRAALDAGLRPLVCVGETLAERDAGSTERVVTTQLSEGLEDLGAAEWGQLILAYEPVWAIGTGRNATPEQAQDVHRLLRAQVSALAGPEIADGMLVLYGGSVKPDNAAVLLAEPDVDGALVGGASLEAKSFLAIVEAAGRRPA
ncbi:MAG TPA: triose-phosphate isomerase [Candidatus Krumholzibacteria bacterium]|nr:triose-phosphate isomerase [Candidatus Krumholzibacteria bacterium]